jgi:hypothetical protein
VAPGNTIADHDHMAKVLRVLAVIVAAAASLVLLGTAFVFGSCEGWKGTGDCPRVPLWEWEVFWIAFWAGVMPVVAARFRWRWAGRTTLEGLAAGTALGSLVVLITAY